MRGGHVLAAGALAVAVLTAGAVLVVVTDASLERSGETICPEGSRLGRLDDTGRSRACTVINTEHPEVQFGVVVSNPGRLPLTVVEMPLEPLDRVGFTPDEIIEGAPPFRLEPGEEQRIVLHGRLPACEVRTTGGATTYTSLAFRVRTLGVTRGLRMPLDPAVRLVSEPC